MLFFIAGIFLFRTYAAAFFSLVHRNFGVLATARDASAEHGAGHTMGGGSPSRNRLRSNGDSIARPCWNARTPGFRRYRTKPTWRCDCGHSHRPNAAIDSRRRSQQFAHLLSRAGPSRGRTVPLCAAGDIPVGICVVKRPGQQSWGERRGIFFRKV